MGPCETEIVSKQMNQKLARFQRSGVTHAVNVDRHDVMLFVGIDHSFLRGGQWSSHEKLSSVISIATKTGSGIAVPSAFLRSARRFVATLIPEKSLCSDK